MISFRSVFGIRNEQVAIALNVVRRCPTLCELTSEWSNINTNIVYPFGVGRSRSNICKHIIALAHWILLLEKEIWLSSCVIFSFTGPGRIINGILEGKSPRPGRRRADRDRDRKLSKLYQGGTLRPQKHFCWERVEPLHPLVQLVPLFAPSLRHVILVRCWPATTCQHDDDMKKKKKSPEADSAPPAYHLISEAVSALQPIITSLRFSHERDWHMCRLALVRSAWRSRKRWFQQFSDGTASVSGYSLHDCVIFLGWMC